MTTLLGLLLALVILIVIRVERQEREENELWATPELRAFQERLKRGEMGVESREILRPFLNALDRIEYIGPNIDDSDIQTGDDNHDERTEGLDGPR